MNSRESVVWIDGIRLTNVHHWTKCNPDPCVIHRPTRHLMTHFPLHWRNDRGIFERICPHGIGHPDPDQFTYWASIGQESQAIHGCDGCCSGNRPTHREGVMYPQMQIDDEGHVFNADTGMEIGIYGPHWSESE